MENANATEADRHAFLAGAARSNSDQSRQSVSTLVVLRVSPVMFDPACVVARIWTCCK